ncbi:HigA family addiction module antitoxin [Burkholderia sp. AU45388]|uniref:HigA family addiction module antitoxin n=1 Tax=Burkholderia sp. AU45388 TaxID=3059206 RepID=UPI002654BE7D|nr:HigA family addiction module antitoxin [Burkholderia sp. AU45388]MDN7430425.1 HigA family addiction module antitoxin [Burkholderia sp. AU45388]
MTRIFNPPHPGETLRDDVLPALGLTVTEAASQLGVTRAALSRILHGHAGISPEMALRLEAWLGEENGGKADLWLAQQSAYDLGQARAKGAPKVARARARMTAHPRTSRQGQYRLGSPGGRVLKRLCTQ